MTDSGPGNPAFRERFLGSYGVNSSIEPVIGNKDRALYERISPHLREDPERAIREVEAELEEDSNPAFRFLLGNLYFQTGRFEDAERYLLQAIEQFPDFRRAHRTLGLIHVQEGQFERAIASWLKVITLGGGDAQSYGLLAYAYLSTQRYESALSAYELARMFRPESVDFRRGIARSLIETRQWDRAVALFDELISDDPGVSEYWLLQANAYLHLKRQGEAIANLELVCDLGRGTSSSLFLLGDLHLQANNHTLALPRYIQALEEADWNPERALHPLRHLLARGLTDEASAYLKLLKKRLPDSLEREQSEYLAVVEAKIAVASGQPEQALSHLKPVVQANPINGEALLLIGQVFQKAGDYEQAQFHFRRALSLPGSKVNARIALGRMEVERGDFTAALEHLRAAHQLESRAGLSRYIESIEAAR